MLRRYTQACGQGQFNTLRPKPHPRRPLFTIPVRSLPCFRQLHANPVAGAQHTCTSRPCSTLGIYHSNTRPLHPTSTQKLGAPSRYPSSHCTATKNNNLVALDPILNAIAGHRHNHSLATDVPSATKMPRTLLLCFIHGFKGNDNTFKNFPQDLQKQVSAKLPDHNVESVVYPKYDTKGELGQCSESLLSWLKEKVMDIRKEHSEKPWPPHDRDVGVILVAHSMGGFVAADTTLLVLNERLANKSDDTVAPPVFPLIQGILTFDTPFNGLARSMFVYGAFSNYSKVSSVFNVMTALSAAPSAFAKKTLASSAGRVPRVATTSKASKSAWKGWQLIAVRSGTVGAIAAGGVAAYVHRQQIMSGMKSMRNLNKESVKEGYQQGIDTLSQGLAYINRGNVGRSFEYLSDHFTFVGALMKQQELSHRLQRLGSLQGIGIHDFYTSLGENGMWSGGYFVPERTFCAIPPTEHKSYSLFTRQVIEGAEEEVQAHMSMFIPEMNKDYDKMTASASDLVIRWFNDDSEIIDEVGLAAKAAPEPIEEPVMTTENGEEIPRTDNILAASTEEKTLEQSAEPRNDGKDDDAADNSDDSLFPDESPMDIAAAASMVPLPTDSSEDPLVAQAGADKKQTYMRYLMGVAQQAGTGVKSYVPTKLPEMPSMPQMPQMPSGPSFKSLIPTQMPDIPAMPTMPSVKIWGKKGDDVGSADAKEATGKAQESTAPASPQPTEKSEGEQAAAATDTETNLEAESGLKAA
ncbi:triacylglycerol lipase [Microdochium nivale]|nr:triacylglycerol lipase [Microdochium nivale]